MGGAASGTLCRDVGARVAAAVLAIADVGRGPAC